MKKGFTLIELLGVIIVLGIIALIITPVVTSTINDTEEKIYKKQVNTIVNVAKEWGIENSDYLPEMDSSASKSISLETLLNSGKIQNSSIIDPRTDEEMTGCVVVSYNSEYSQYEYKYNDDQNYCESIGKKICVYDESSTVAKGQLGAKYNCTVVYGVTKQFYLIEIGGRGLTRKDRDSVQYTGEAAGTADVGEVALIMTENIDEGTTKFEESGDLKGPLTALAYLDARTTNWREDIKTFLPTYSQYTNISPLIHDTDYWLSSLLNEGQADPVACVKEEGYNLCGRNGNELGVRPVITIPAEQCEL